jgi:histidinol phosphatase-like PHP family hydrolase
MDSNLRVAALLRDLAAIQAEPQKRWGYRRAAEAILALDVPLESLVQPDGSLRKIPGIGPSSTRVILEVLRSGASATVDQAVAASPKRRDVERSRSLRTHFLSRAQVVAALENDALTGPTLRSYRGDLQMHSVWSDGRHTIEEMAEACRARGYQYMAVTDHSHGLPIARGMSAEAMADQHRDIDGVNRRLAGRFRVLKGIEANIRADGSLDLSADELARCEIVVAAPHAVLRSADDQTPRVLAALATRGVHILGHPRGRMLGSRGGIVADWDRIFRAAAAARVAIEIDGDPSRQDIDHTLASRALACGCLFALDSDAHATDELAYAETAIAHARLAGIPPDRVVNCWPLDRLLEWAATRR